MLAVAVGGCAGGRETVEPAVAAEAGANMVSDTPVRIGEPYAIGGARYTPVDQIDYDEVGYASWYGSELAGRPTANGEAFTPAGISAAHRTLPLPSYVEVTRLDTGRTILVRINDRGPADPGRLIDLSAGAAQQLGLDSPGIVPVRVRRVNPVESERAALRRALPVPARVDTPDGLLEILRDRAARLPRPEGSAPTAAASPEPRSGASVAAPARPSSLSRTGTLIVQVGAYASRARAEEVARRTGATVVQAGSLYRVRYLGLATQADAQAAIARARAAGQPGAVIVRGQ